MRTNIVLDDELVKTCMEYTGIKTKKELVEFALREVVIRRQRKEILGLRGKVKWEGNLDEMRFSEKINSPK